MGSLVFCDTRQQRGKHNHVNAWMAEHGVRAVSMMLETGDYSAPGSNVLVDTKKDVQEVAGNVGRDHARFVRECDRARDSGYRLIVLVEERPEYNDRDKLFRWVPYTCRRCRKCNPLRSNGCTRYRAKPMCGPAVARIIHGIEENHAVRFEFCRKRDTARRICEILGIEYDREGTR